VTKFPPELSCVSFYWRPLGGQRFLVGTAERRPRGWRFIPNVSGRMSSRKFHPSLEKCLPRWVGYPDRCESEVLR